MQNKSVVVLTVDEAREALVKHFTDFLVGNPAHLAALLRDGKLDEMPNLSTATAKQVTELYRNNVVGAGVGSVDAVLVHLGGFTLEVVYENKAKPVPAPTPSPEPLAVG